MKKFDYDIEDEEYLKELENALSEEDNSFGNGRARASNEQYIRKASGRKDSSPSNAPLAGYMLFFCLGILLTSGLFGGFMIVNRLRNPSIEDVPWSNQQAMTNAKDTTSDAIPSVTDNENIAKNDDTEAGDEDGSPDTEASEAEEIHSDNNIVSPEELEDAPRLDDEGKVIKDTIPASAIQVVALGDSIWDIVRGDDGISHILSTGLEGAYVYNCSFGATTATLVSDSGDEYLDRHSLTSIVDYVVGSIGIPASPEDGDGYNALARADFSRTEYFVLSFGLIDFFNNKYINNDYFDYDKYSFTGALRYSVQKLQEKYPDAKVIVAAPNYVYGNPSNAHGNIDSYINACEAIAQECNAMFFNPNAAMGMNSQNCSQFLADGAYLNAISRTLYADALAAMILEDRS